MFDSCLMLMSMLVAVGFGVVFYAFKRTFLKETDMFPPAPIHNDLEDWQ